MDLANFKSINAEGSMGTSGKYAFIPTTRVIDTLATQGWFPVKAGEKRCKKVTHQGFQEHLIRFRQEHNFQSTKIGGQFVPAVVGDIVPEIVLKNSHNGLSSFQIMAGLFRFVCTNGMVVADSLFATHRIKHIGYKDQDVIDATFNVISTTPQIMNRVEQFKTITLSPEEQLLFAEASLTAKYGQPEEAPEGEIPINTRFDLTRLALPVRTQDGGDRYKLVENTLWNSFNILQEKLVERGGRFAKVAPQSLRVKEARGISSVSENVRVNQALWQLTQKMAELKG